MNRTPEFKCEICGSTGTGIFQKSDYTTWYSKPENWYSWYDGKRAHVACSLSCFEKLRGFSLVEYREKIREFINIDKGTIGLTIGLGCPWCEAESNYGHHDIATCSNGHKWKWFPLGG